MMQAMEPEPGAAPEASALKQFREFIYGAYSDTHPVFGNEAGEAGAGRVKNLEAFLPRALPPGKTAAILDFGCGDGVLLAVAQSLGYSDLTGVDLSAALLQKAAGRTSARLKHGDGLEFLKSSSGGAFEAVAAFDILEHLTRPELLEVCREIFRVLKPGGCLLVRVPNGSSPFHGQIFWGDITHERAFTQSSLAQLLLPLGAGKIDAMEEAPVPHGLKSSVRAILWQFFRAATVFRLAVETGQLRGHILTRNLLLVAQKKSN